MTLNQLGRNIYEESNYLKESLMSLIYQTTLSSTLKHNSSSMYYQVFPYNDDQFDDGHPQAGKEDTGNFVVGVANSWKDNHLGEYARQWINTVKPDVAPYLLAGDLGGSARPFTNLPNDYYSPGTRHLFTKNGWDANSTSIMLQLGLPNDAAGHRQLDGGSFQIWRSGHWLSKESTGYSDTFVGYGGSGTIGSGATAAHNTLLFNGVGLADSPINGPSIVTRVESRANYSFASTNLIDLYRNDRVPYSRPERDNPHIQSVVRDFVNLKAIETLVVFDRVRSTTANVVKTFLLHFPNNPQINSTTKTVVGINDTQELRLTSLTTQPTTFLSVDEKPSGTTQSGVDFQYRLEVNTQGNATDSYLINVLQAKDKGSITPNVVPTLTEDANNYTITLKCAGKPDQIVVFKKGMVSQGGSVNGSPLLERVQQINVTNNGVQWEVLPGDPQPKIPQAPKNLRLQ